MMRFPNLKWLVAGFVVSLGIIHAVPITFGNNNEIVAKVFEAPKNSQGILLHPSPDGRKVWAMLVSISRTTDSFDVIFSIIQPAISLDVFSHAIVDRANVNASNPWSSLLALAYSDPSISSLAEQFCDWVVDKKGMVIYGYMAGQPWYDHVPSVIKAVKIATRKQLWEKSIPQISSNLALSPDGRQIWVASDQAVPVGVIGPIAVSLPKYYDEARVIYVINAQDGRILKRIGYVGGLGANRIVFSNDMKRAICIARGGPAGLLVIDAESLKIEKGWCQTQVSMFSSGMDACFDPDGRFLYILERGFNSPPSVRVYDLLSRTQIDTILLPTKSPARTMVLSKPADKLFIGADDGIYVVNLREWRK